MFQPNIILLNSSPSDILIDFLYCATFFSIILISQYRSLKRVAVQKIPYHHKAHTAVAVHKINGMTSKDPELRRRKVTTVTDISSK